MEGQRRIKEEREGLAPGVVADGCYVDGCLGSLKSFDVKWSILYCIIRSKCKIVKMNNLAFVWLKKWGGGNIWCAPGGVV